MWFSEHIAFKIRQLTEYVFLQKQDGDKCFLKETQLKAFQQSSTFWLENINKSEQFWIIVTWKHYNFKLRLQSLKIAVALEVFS